jgi:hypothetical protein
MTPRARRSESITLPPGNHPVLIRYNDEKASFSTGSLPKDEDHERPAFYRVKSVDSFKNSSDSEVDIRRNDSSDFKDYDSDTSDSSIH